MALALRERMLLYAEICRHLNQPEQLEVKRLLGWDAIEQNEALLREVASLSDMLDELYSAGSRASAPRAGSGPESDATGAGPRYRRGSSKAGFERQLLQQQIQFFVERIQKARRGSAPLTGGSAPSAPALARPSTAAGRPPTAGSALGTAGSAGRLVPSTGAGAPAAMARPPSARTTLTTASGGRRPASAATSVSSGGASAASSSAAAEVVDGVRDSLSVFTIDKVLDTLKGALAEERAELAEDVEWLQSQINEALDAGACAPARRLDEDGVAGVVAAAAGSASGTKLPTAGSAASRRLDGAAAALGTAASDGECNADESEGDGEGEGEDLDELRAIKHQLQSEYLSLEGQGDVFGAAAAAGPGRPEAGEVGGSEPAAAARPSRLAAKFQAMRAGQPPATGTGVGDAPVPDAGAKTASPASPNPHRPPQPAATDGARAPHAAADAASRAERLRAAIDEARYFN